MSSATSYSAPEGHNGPSRPPHGLIDELLGALTYDRETEQWTFGEGFAAVAIRIRAIRDAGELLEITQDLLRLGYFLEVRRRSREPADAVLGLVRALAPTIVNNDTSVSRWEAAQKRLASELNDDSRTAGIAPSDANTGVGLRRGRSR